MKPIEPIQRSHCLKALSRALAALFAVLAAFAALCGASCSKNDDYQQCRQEEDQGRYTYDKDDACGCEKLACTQGTKCFHGDCCDPTLYATDHDKCGCGAACAETEVCRDGACCDPASDAASSHDACGCAGPCGDREKCERSSDGAYQCACDEKLALADRDNCGCTGTVCDPDTERCRNGKCECDTLSGAAQQDDNNCACRGECPFVIENGEKVRTAYCYSGICHCFSADEVICNGKCMKEADCHCEPAKHIDDANDCSCNGPCAAGDICLAGSCVCNALAHDADDANCGCGGACDVANGLHCEQGSCVCPAAKLNDALNCGCHGPCDVAHGYECQQGVCTCPPAQLSNDALCGCKQACDVAHGYRCTQGSCDCPAAELSDNTNCGCSGHACDTGLGFTCSGGACLCSQQAMEDPDHCGCGPACPKVTVIGSYNWICQAGTCQCPNGSHLCTVPGNLSPALQAQVHYNVCWPDTPGGGNAIPELCEGCFTTCAPPSHCNYTFDGQGTITDVGCQ